jgi:hypothetical protein
MRWDFGEEQGYWGHPIHGPAHRWEYYDYVQVELPLREVLMTEPLTSQTQALMLLLLQLLLLLRIEPEKLVFPLLAFGSPNRVL